MRHGISGWRAWAATRERRGRAQLDAIDIAADDAISDWGVEIWNLLEQRGIANVVLLGVHTNMCVLGRPFGLRQLAKNGKNVVLMRDMTEHDVQPASLAARDALRRDRAGRGTHRTGRLPDDHERRFRGRRAVPVSS
jgi:nicotinamidase-related amidase